MKLKFKTQAYQTSAVESVVNCFSGQVFSSGVTYRIDPGRAKVDEWLEQSGFKNTELQLTDIQLLANIQKSQQEQSLPSSETLKSSAGCKINLDVEMETGTGKTYCYIKTIFEMNKTYGWTKFIIVVPSIAIREGVNKSLEITANHFAESYHKKIRFFIYNSKQLHHLEGFSSDSGINVMIINIQAFNATGADNRRIYEELDDFQSRKPIDVISSNRPIIILDEPQKMEGARTLDGLAKFNPLIILRYSATHRTTYNKVHRLDALDAYNQKLVKKIAVRGITVKGLSGTNAYLYLESIEISKNAPVARIELEVKQASGNIKRTLKRLTKGTDLFVESGEMDQYRGFVISQIDANADTVDFTNGHQLIAGEATGDVNEMAVRKIQIRETIKAHLDKEKQLFSLGIKVLSLFFIDEVAKYRDYSVPDEKGEYARMFEEEYESLKTDYLSELAFDNDAYRKYLSGVPVKLTHNGYFSIDKKSKQLKDPDIVKKTGDSDDVDAYDLILKDKEKLLSFEEPVRFIFSHSALREGWDNPNVFVICTLKHSDNMISRRQEVGRGLRLAVNRYGDRMDQGLVHDINLLTVVASESYKEFVASLQKEISESLSERPRKADEAYFTGKSIQTATGTLEISSSMSKQIYKYLLKNDYTDDQDRITKTYHEAKANGSLVNLPTELVPYAEQIFKLIDSVFNDSQLPEVDDGRKAKANPLNTNFDKKEFKELWNRINHKAIYRVEFDSTELVANCIKTLDKELKVTPLQFRVERGEQNEQTTFEQMKRSEGFEVKEDVKQEYSGSIQSNVKYDLLGKLATNTHLTRKTIASVLVGIKQDVFEKFKQNPEHFIVEASRLINEQKATVIIERLTYDTIAETHNVDIFTTGQSKQDFTKASEKLKNHIYDYVITDSKVERTFAKELDVSSEVIVYAKLPTGFFIPTPVGNYNPDWAISFKEGTVKHIYFVAETKGSMSSMDLRKIESTKIECARKFFNEINRKINPKNVKYDVVDNYSKLMSVVGVGNV